VKPRLATQRDVAALARLINAAYRVEDFFINGDRTDERDVRARLEAPGAAFLVIDTPAGGGLAGAVYVEVREKRGYFGLLSVDPARQKQGLGRALVDAVEAHCRAAGCRVLDIDVVNLRHELPAFYSALGFVPAGTAPFPDPAKLTRPAHLVMMTKPLAAA
jgi:GNAT superfamily N-acetyltransferase